MHATSLGSQARSADARPDSPRHVSRADQESTSTSTDKDKTDDKNKTSDMAKAMDGIKVEIPWWAWMMTGILVTVVALWVFSLCFALFRTAWLWEWPRVRAAAPVSDLENAGPAMGEMPRGGV
jgi:hypothetical protein